MFSRFNRGSSVLAALVLVGALAVATLAVQALSGPQNPQAQSAAGSVWDNAQQPTVTNMTVSAPTTPTSAAGASISNNSPKDCNAAKQVALNKTSDPTARSTGSGKSGILDSCHGAYLISGKTGKSVSDYQCVGRSGSALIVNGTVTVVSSADKGVKDGTCNIKVCNGSMAESSCAAAKLYNGGVFSSLVNGAPVLNNSPIAQTMNYGYGQTGAPAGGVSVANGYYVDANGVTQIESAFNPSTAATTPIKGWSETYDSTQAWPADDKSADPMKFAPVNAEGDPTIYSAGLRGCADGNCDTLTKEDLTPEKQTPDPTLDCNSPGNENANNPRCWPTLTGNKTGGCPAGQINVGGTCKTQGATIERRDTGSRDGRDGQQQTPEKPGGGGGGLDGLMKAILGGLAQGLAKGLAQQPAQACPSDPNAYQQQQQQYNQQMQQYNYQLQQYNYQQQLSYMNGMPAPIPPTAPQPCTPRSDSNTCPAAPQQPNPAGCQNGTWRPITTQQGNGYQCTTGWQCVPGGGTVPKAEISCSPKVADVGMTVTIAYGCSNATGSTGQGFDTQNQLSGSTTTVISAPPAGATSANFVLNCTNQGASARAQCSVQIGRPTIVLVANPKVVDPGKASTIGWITTGMQSCVVSSPEDGAFTAENATNTSVNGMASTSPLTSPIHILLHCVTVGGGTRDATTTVSVVGQPDIIDPDPNSGTVTVQSTADATSTSRGSTVTISWSATNPPSGAHIALWLYDVRLNTTTALIADGLAASSTYAWHLPNANDTCDPESIDVCGADLVPGRQYGIEADLYTDTSDPNNPNIVDYGFTPDPFTISS